MNRLILCADDFGLNTAINDAIVELVAAGRLNTVSCMALGPAFTDTEVDRLRQAAAQAPHDVEIGLHLTLTEYAPVGAMPLLAPTGSLPTIGTLIKRSFRNTLDGHEIENELQQQLSVFRSRTGQLPDFVDGHQHVHVLPRVRDATLNLVQHHTPSSWVRSCYASAATIVRTRTSVGRALFISSLSRRLKLMLDHHDVATNALFLGVNGFDAKQDFGLAMRRWLAAARKDVNLSEDAPFLVMCHPGVSPRPEPIGLHDPIAQRRPDELAYLSSPHFSEDLRRAGFTLAS